MKKGGDTTCSIDFWFVSLSRPFSISQIEMAGSLEAFSFQRPSCGSRSAPAIQLAQCCKLSKFGIPIHQYLIDGLAASEHVNRKCSQITDLYCGSNRHFLKRYGSFFQIIFHKILNPVWKFCFAFCKWRDEIPVTGNLRHVFRLGAVINKQHCRINIRRILKHIET